MPRPASVGLPALIASTLAALVSVCAEEYVAAGEGVRFVPYGINAEFALLLVFLTVAALFVHREARAAFLSALMLLTAATSLLGAAGLLVHWLVPFDPAKIDSWASYAKVLGYSLLYLLWGCGAIFALLRSVRPERRFNLWRTVGFLAASALPYEPMFRGRNFDIRTANYWEYIGAIRSGSFSNEAPPRRVVNRPQVELAQATLLDEEISHLAPEQNGKTNIYAIGLARWSEQDVFVKELNGGLQSLARVLSLDGHILRLINHPDTVTSTPIASRQNFAADVHAVAKVMDREEDVLVVFMTSHGSETGVALWLPGATSADLSPTEVASVLDGEGIKNRVVIVSACYSGVFVKPLANEHTMPGGDLKEAFLDAKVAIAQWETHYGLQHSNPQGYFGRELMAKLAPLYQSASVASPKAMAVSR
jgi:Peptidase C13 family